MASSHSKAQGTEPQLGDSPIEQVIAALTREEKVKLIRGIGMGLSDSSSEQGGPAVGEIREHRVPGAAGSTHAVPRLGIPSIVLADGPAGLRIAPRRDGSDQSYFATAFPIATLLASSWDVDLVERVGMAMGHEVKEYGVDVLLAPAMNLHRYPLGGRNFEYYSEDPLVSGKMAAAMVRGVQSEGVGTSIKHYVANNHEWNRFSMNVKVDERALREIYLRGFEIAVKEGRPWTLMSSYNLVNGEYTSESARLLTEILRDEWGFEGLVTTDWFAGSNPIEQVRAGNDLLMPGVDEQEQAIRAALDDGALDEALVDRNLGKILKIVAQSPNFSGYAYSDAPNLEANAKIARSAAAEGMVLLKNAGEVLPLEVAGRVALFGNHAYDLITGGTGSGDVAEAYTISLQEGLETAGISVDADLAAEYHTHIEQEKAKRPQLEGIAAFMPQEPIAELGLASADIDALARSNAAAILVIGRTSGEFTDRKAQGDFYLSDTEHMLIERVSGAFRAQNKPVVAVLNIGGVIETASWRDHVDALLIAWQPGQEAGHATADVLLGANCPSGKLADTFPIKLEDFPAAENFPGIETGETTSLPGLIPATPSQVEYKDGIWVGYRHFNSNGVEVAYPFGYGLSYTQFSYQDLRLSSEQFSDQLRVFVEVTNVGRVAGKEVVQLYLAAPQTDLEKPAEELRAFAKTGLLAPGESQVLEFTLRLRDLASFDASRNAWVAAAGDYSVKIGASSRDFRKTASFRKATESLATT